MANPLPFPTPRPARVAIVGVGNELNGDDAVGARVARELQRRLQGVTGVLVIDAGAAPENYTGPLRRFGPSLVIEVDAAHQEQPPGTVAWIDWKDADGLSASTHTLPPSVLAEFLVAELRCDVALIGVQPATLEMGEPMSPEVERAAQVLVDDLCRWLKLGRHS